MTRSDLSSASLSLVPGARGPLVPVPRPRPVEEVAGDLGATDLLVLRQVEPGRFLQIGGVGRGAGWAGSLELLAREEPLLRAALSTGRVLRWSADVPSPVLGPYHARCAALVAVTHDVVVLVGGDGPLAGDDAVVDGAKAAVAGVEAVTPAKRLADELELLAALRAVMHVTPASVRDALHHVATSAAEALSCEVAVAWLPGVDELVVVERGWSLRAAPGDLRRALAPLRGLRTALLAQDSSSAPLAEPLGPQAGARSHYVLPLGEDGVLVLLHTAAAPRGFTGLCRTIGQRVAEAAAVVVQGSVLRAELEQLVEQAERTARVDPLTGVANRLGWDEAVAAAGADPATVATVLVVDLNGLKAVNDRHGHELGDRYLQESAEALRAVARRGDTVARLGGDEFGLLLVGADADAAALVVDRLRVAVADAASRLSTDLGGLTLSAAVGAAVRAPGERLRETWCRADSAMYDDKTAARAATG